MPSTRKSLVIVEKRTCSIKSERHLDFHELLISELEKRIKLIIGNEYKNVLKKIQEFTDLICPVTDSGNVCFSQLKEKV